MDQSTYQEEETELYQLRELDSRPIPSRIAYITSMATGGLAGFNYKELVEFKNAGKDVGIYITKFCPGPYMPPDGMTVSTAKPLSVIMRQAVPLFRSPWRYLKLLAEAISTRTVVDFLVAQAWSAHM